MLLLAAVGLIMGVGVTAAVNLARPDDVEIVSSTTLTALPGETGEVRRSSCAIKGDSAADQRRRVSSVIGVPRGLVDQQRREADVLPRCPALNGQQDLPVPACSETRWTVSRSSMSPWSRTTATPRTR